jgi:hypothetical protein
MAFSFRNISCENAGTAPGLQAGAAARGEALGKTTAGALNAVADMIKAAARIAGTPKLASATPPCHPGFATGEDRDLFDSRLGE